MKLRKLKNSNYYYFLSGIRNYCKKLFRSNRRKCNALQSCSSETKVFADLPPSCSLFSIISYSLKGCLFFTFIWRQPSWGIYLPRVFRWEKPLDFFVCEITWPQVLFVTGGHATRCAVSTLVKSKTQLSLYSIKQIKQLHVHIRLLAPCCHLN